MTQQLGATVHELVQRLDDGNQVQFGQHHQRLNEHDQQIQNLQELVAKPQQDIHKGFDFSHYCQERVSSDTGPARWRQS